MGALAAIGPSPSTTTTVITTYPSISPPTAGPTTRPRTPAAMMYAQSGPGTAISAKDSAANAMITLVSTISLPQTILPTWENSTVKPAQCAPYFQSQTNRKSTRLNSSHVS